MKEDGSTCGMFVKVTGGMSLAEGSFCGLGPEACDGRPVRITGG